MGLEGAPRGAVFGREPEVRVKPLLEGPQFDDDPLRTVYRVVEGLEAIYSDPPFFLNTPWLLTPSRAKALYADRFRYFWRGMGRAGGYNLGMVIIGYSLPSHDDYAKQVLFRMARNYQDSWWDQELVDGRKKSPIVVVDRQNSDANREAFLSRFGFLNPGKVAFHFSGFDERALELIRSTS